MILFRKHQNFLLLAATMIGSLYVRVILITHNIHLGTRPSVSPSVQYYIAAGCHGGGATVRTFSAAGLYM
jgi:hypothetical protein